MVLVASCLLATSCFSADSALVTTPGIPAVAAELELWPRLLQQKPYPYTTPLPPPAGTVIDGTYSKFDPREGTRPFCRRCMPYPAEGGLWLLQFDKGIYRILSARSLSGWRSLGSYTVSDHRLVLFNDPHCMTDVGVYGWDLAEDRLVLEVVEDECADGWRGITFTNHAWVVEE
jgi:hypothetical protein